jgi:hypothetical protein
MDGGKTMKQARNGQKKMVGGKTMNRNTKKLAVIGLVVGCLLIGGVSVFAFGEGNAYQDFKAGALRTIMERNMTVAAEMNVRQDGVTILSGETVFQIDGDAQYSSGKIRTNGETVDLENSERDGVKIMRVGDRYMSVTGWDHDFENFPTALKLAEMITDFLVGDVKTHFYGNGGAISVNLEGAQIPEILNVAASAVVEQIAARPRRMSSENKLFRDVIEDISIAQDVSIKRVSMESQLKNGYIENLTGTVVLTGKDKSGASHEIEITRNAAISDIGSTTTPGVVNTEGKNVTEVTKRERFCR